METTTENSVKEYVNRICSDNIEYRNNRWYLRYSDESLNSSEIADQLSYDLNIPLKDAINLVREWKRGEEARIEEYNRKRIEETVNFPIPDRVMEILHRLEKLFGIVLEFCEYPIELRNRGGYGYAMGKGITLTYCTSSLADGPSYDYSKEIMEILKPFKFEIVNSYGDNGMDSATNWHDTFWMYDIVYTPSICYLD